MKHDHCTCDEEEHEPHECPYDQELNPENVRTCTCCPFCEYQCCMDI